MIKVSIKTSTIRETKMVAPTTTVNDILEMYGINVGNNQWQVNSRVLRGDDFSKLLTELGIYDACFLTSVVKMDNA